MVLLLVNGFRYGGGYLNKYSELRKLSAQVNNAKSKVQELRKKVKTAEKQLKDFQRTADLNIGSRDCLPYLAYLSEKLPIEIRVTNFRWNEDSVDLNLQTTAPELDLVSFFNRLPGTKILNASQRTNPGNGLTSGNIKLAWDTEKLQIAVPVAEEVQQ